MNGRKTRSRSKKAPTTPTTPPASFDLSDGLGEAQRDTTTMNEGTAESVSPLIPRKRPAGRPSQRGKKKTPNDRSTFQAPLPANRTSQPPTSEVLEEGATTMESSQSSTPFPVTAPTNSAPRIVEQAPSRIIPNGRHTNLGPQTASTVFPPSTSTGLFQNPLGATSQLTQPNQPTPTIFATPPGATPEKNPGNYPAPFRSAFVFGANSQVNGTQAATTQTTSTAPQVGKFFRSGLPGFAQTKQNETKTTITTTPQSSGPSSDFGSTARIEPVSYSPFGGTASQSINPLGGTANQSNDPFGALKSTETAVVIPFGHPPTTITTTSEVTTTPQTGSFIFGQPAIDTPQPPEVTRPFGAPRPVGTADSSPLGAPIPAGTAVSGPFGHPPVKTFTTSEQTPSLQPSPFTFGQSVQSTTQTPEQTSTIQPGPFTFGQSVQSTTQTPEQTSTIQPSPFTFGQSVQSTTQPTQNSTLSRSPFIFGSQPPPQATPPAPSLFIPTSSPPKKADTALFESPTDRNRLVEISTNRTSERPKSILRRAAPSSVASSPLFGQPKKSANHPVVGAPVSSSPLINREIFPTPTVALKIDSKRKSNDKQNESQTIMKRQAFQPQSLTDKVTNAYNLVGFGTYGFVFRPHLYCQDRYTDKRYFVDPLSQKILDSVGKVLRDYKDGKREAEVHKLISTRLDPCNLFTTRYLGSCAEAVVQKNEIVGMPPGIDIDWTLYRYQIISEFGGKCTLHKQEFQFRDFFVYAVALLYSISYLNEEIIHFDIKLDNVLFHPGSKSFRLIDYSVAGQAKELVDLIFTQYVVEFFESNVRKADFYYFRQMTPEVNLILNMFIYCSQFIKSSGGASDFLQNVSDHAQHVYKAVMDYFVTFYNDTVQTPFFNLKTQLSERHMVDMMTKVFRVVDDFYTFLRASPRTVSTDEIPIPSKIKEQLSEISRYFLRQKQDIWGFSVWVMDMLRYQDIKIEGYKLHQAKNMLGLIITEKILLQHDPNYRFTPIQLISQLYKDVEVNGILDGILDSIQNYFSNKIPITLDESGTGETRNFFVKKQIVYYRDFTTKATQEW